MMLLGQQKFWLLQILITALAGCRLTMAALQFNLSATCSGSSAYYCSVKNLVSNSEQPLEWITDTPAPDVNELIIHNSALGRFPSLVFEIAPNLHTLIMHKSLVHSIEASDFENATHLHKLVLKNNHLFNIPERLFAGLFELEELCLAHDTLHMIHRNAFDGLQRLKYLDLQHNGIRELPTAVFDDLINLEHLDLSNNELETITAQTFAKNSKLKTLLLSDNKFSAFEPNSLMHFEHLHTLDLSNTLIEELQVQSVDLLLVPSSKLQRCIISGSVIKLTASNNALGSITIHDKLAVRELDLHGNLFQSLDALVGMWNLQKLDISRNQLMSLKTTHSPLYLPFPSLVSLNLNTNHLANLSAENFILLLKLKSLDLAFNQLKRLDTRIFQSLLNLEKLYLEGNNLFELNTAALIQSHKNLYEVGIYQNDFGFAYLKSMLSFFRFNNIHVPLRFGSTPALVSPSARHHDAAGKPPTPFELDDMGDLLDPQSTSLNPLDCVDGIHPHTTANDVVTLLTLILVLVILVLQVARIVHEANCLPILRRHCWPRCSQESQPELRRHCILEEETSNV